MLPKEFEALIRNGDIGRVTIFRTNPESAWSVYGYGEALPPDTINHLAINKTGSKRLWSDLDAAYGFIRKSGFKQAIEVDG